MSIKQFERLPDTVVELLGTGDTEQDFNDRLAEMRDALRLQKNIKAAGENALDIALDYSEQQIKDEMRDLLQAIKLLPAYEKLTDNELDELFVIWGHI